MKLSEVLPWAVPVVLSILAVSFQLYGLIDKVEKIQHIQDIEGATAIRKLDNIEWRVKNLEELCCSERDR